VNVWINLTIRGAKRAMSIALPGFFSSNLKSLAAAPDRRCCRRLFLPDCLQLSKALVTRNTLPAIELESQAGHDQRLARASQV